jgi:hypothetical protein
MATSEPSCYLPFPDGGPSEPVPARAVMMCTIPSGWMFANYTTGLWSDCAKLPEACLLLNGALFFIEAAHAAECTVYVEQIIDYERFECIPTAVRTHALRIWAPMSSTQIAAFLLQGAMMLSPANQAAATAATTSRKRKSINESPSTPEPTAGVGNIELGHKAINNMSAFCRYVSTSKGGMEASSFSQINFRMLDEGGTDGELVDSDGEDGPSDLVDVLPPNNFAVIMTMDQQFTCDYDGIHPDQADKTKYYNDGYFQFPSIVAESDLVTTIACDAPFMCGTADGLLKLALPGATLAMSKEELKHKIQSLQQSGGKTIQDMSEWTWAALRDELFAQSGGGGKDPTIFSPIQIQDDLTRQHSPDMCTESEMTLAQIYPRDGAYRLRIVHEFREIGAALRDGRLDEEKAREYIQQIEVRIIGIYTGPAKSEMPEKYFEVERETNELMQGMTDDVARGSALATKAMQFLYGPGRAAMPHTHTLLCRFSEELRNALHKTAPQASFIVFAWLVSHITYIPEIHQSQVWIILLGGSDTGKSDAMNCVAMLVPRAVLVREDNQSKMAIVENAEVGT